MTIKRAHVKKEEYDLYFTWNAKNLCIFVHGLGGDEDRAYWGDLPKLLQFEPHLKETDICFWRYTSSRRPLANLFALARRGRSLAPVPELAVSLSSTISSLVVERQYDRTYLVGHSLGGCLSILAAYRQIVEKVDSRITRLRFLSMPGRLSVPVKTVSFFWFWNPQVKWLRSKNLRKTCGEALAEVRAAGIETTYVRSTLDEIAHTDRELVFDHYEACEVTHSWPSRIHDRKSVSYQLLMNWLVAQSELSPAT